MEVVSGITVGNMKTLQQSKSCITKIVIAMRNPQIMCACMREDLLVSSTPFPARQDIDITHIKSYSGKDIQTEATLPVAIMSSNVARNPGIDVRAINCTKTVIKVGVELQILFDFNRGFCLRNLDILTIERCANHEVKNFVYVSEVNINLELEG
jgi:hypothetical protein